MPLVVLDTNVLVASLLNSASCRAILTEWRHGRFDVAISSPLRRELRRVLKRPKFRSRVHQEDIDELLAFVDETAVLDVGPIGGLRVLTPTAFLSWLKGTV